MFAANTGASRMYSAEVTTRMILIVLLQAPYRSFLVCMSAAQKVSVASQNVSDNK